jgi:hypothetical protein
MENLYATHHLGIVLLRAKRYEKVLRDKFDAKGSGLGGLVRYCGYKLSQPIRVEFDYFVRVRNEMIHEDGRNEVENVPRLTRCINSIEEEFALISPKFSERPVAEDDFDPKPEAATVFACNLPENITEIDIWDLFAFAGRTLTVEMAINTKGTCRGCAIVDMASRCDAANAIAEYDGKTIAGRELILLSRGRGRITDGNLS